MGVEKSSVTQWGRDNGRGRYVVCAASVYWIAVCRGDMKGIVLDKRAMFFRQ